MIRQTSLKVGNFLATSLNCLSKERQIGTIEKMRSSYARAFAAFRATSVMG